MTTTTTTMTTTTTTVPAATKTLKMSAVATPSPWLHNERPETVCQQADAPNASCDLAWPVDDLARAESGNRISELKHEYTNATRI